MLYNDCLNARPSFHYQSWMCFMKEHLAAKLTINTRIFKTTALSDFTNLL